MFSKDVYSDKTYIDSVHLTKTDLSESKLLYFCSLVSSASSLSGVFSIIIHMHYVFFLHDNWISSSSTTNVAIALSHLYLIIFGVILCLAEKESNFIFKYFVRFL